MITKMHSNGTALISTKTSKHDHLVNTHLIIKYNKPIKPEEEQARNTQTLEMAIPKPPSLTRQYNKHSFHQDLMEGQLQEARKFKINLYYLQLIHIWTKTVQTPLRQQI
jgi:hypothetical protein